MQVQILEDSLTLLVRRLQRATCTVSGFIKWLTFPFLGDGFYQAGRNNMVERMVFASVKTLHLALVNDLRVGTYVKKRLE